MQTKTSDTADSPPDVSVHPLTEADLAPADRVFRLAFGTFVGMPEPANFMGDADFVRTRWRANPSAAFAAYVDDALAGSNFASNWGSVGFFGPLTVRPDLWDRGIGKRLMEPIIACFETWGTRHAGLFTFSHSHKHVGLYQRFGFWPRFLTAIMTKPAGRVDADLPTWTTFSSVAAHDRDAVLAEARQVTGAIHDGLDVSAEIRSVADQGLGDTVLLRRDGELAALAVCHCGPGTEAGSGTCYVKFAGVRPGRTAAGDFDRLLTVSEAFAAGAGAANLTAGVNTARHEAYARMLERGFRTQMQGVSMHRPNDTGYSRPGVYVLDDWR
jgi:GNAT superfamily N-acetyltransferase